MTTVNLDYLRDLADGSVEFMEEMIDMFFEQAPESINDIQTAMSEKDYPRLRAYAHKMKSSVSIVGADDLLTKLKTCETNAATETNVEDLPALVEAIVKETDEVLEILKEKKGDL